MENYSAKMLGPPPVVIFNKKTTSVGKKICGVCQTGFDNQKELCSHVSSNHSQRADIVTLEFNSEVEFQSWKSRIELEKNAKFSTTHSGRDVRRRFLCHRSGQFKSKASEDPSKSRAPRSTPSVRIGFTCTAFITAYPRGNNGAVSVEACLDHYGRGCAVKHLPLSEDTKAKIVRMLKDHRSVNYR